MRLVRATLAVLASLPLHGQSISDFAWVGDAGNEATVDLIGRPQGHVPYEFGIRKRELSVGEWIEFLEASAEFFPMSGVYGPDPTDFRFTGDSVVGYFDTDAGRYQYVPELDHTLESAALVPRRQAARYINWLHNDRALTSEAFEQGVYDTTTFSGGGNSATDDYTRSSDARYAIASIHEVVKALYYDPNRYGENEGGYWRFPNGSNIAPISGLPEDGGQTSTGLGTLGMVPSELPPGLYDDVTSSYGLFDGSGGLRELTEDGLTNSTYVCGSMPFHIEVFDALEFVAAFGPRDVHRGGLRIVILVPSPGHALLPIAGCLLLIRRR